MSDLFLLFHKHSIKEVSDDVVPAPTPNIIFDIDHETGDLTQYTSTVTDSGDLSVQVAAALASTSYGLQCVIDDTTAIYGQKTFANNTSGDARLRIYIDPNGMSLGTDNEFPFASFYNGADSLATVWLNYSSGFRISVGINTDAGASYSSYYAITDAPHYIEIYLQRATAVDSSDGSLQLWIDGVSKETLSGKDNYDQFDGFSIVNVGMLAGTYLGSSTGTFFLDELVVSDNDVEIGPV